MNNFLKLSFLFAFSLIIFTACEKENLSVDTNVPDTVEFRDPIRPDVGLGDGMTNCLTTSGWDINECITVGGERIFEIIPFGNVDPVWSLSNGNFSFKDGINTGPSVIVEANGVGTATLAVEIPFGEGVCSSAKRICAEEDEDPMFECPESSDITLTTKLDCAEDLTVTATGITGPALYVWQVGDNSFNTGASNILNIPVGNIDDDLQFAFITVTIYTEGCPPVSRSILTRIDC